MTDRDEVLAEATGVVRTWAAARKKDGDSYVRALVVKDSRQPVEVLWWDPDDAAEAGVDVHVRGRSKVFRGQRQLHADATEPVFREPPSDRATALVGYYRDCVRAETATALRLRPNHGSCVIVSEGPSPFHGGMALSDKRYSDWLRARRRARDELLLVGWPLAVGRDRVAGEIVDLVSPLLVGPGRLADDDGQPRLELEGAAVEVNPAACELLGLTSAEAEAVVAAVSRSIDLDEAPTLRGRVAVLVELLGVAGISGLDTCTPAAMSGGSPVNGIQDAAVAAVGDPGGGAVQWTIAELKQLLLRPSLLAEGPASAILGSGPVGERTAARAVPTIMPSSVRQDEAVSAALSDVLTVVTGPPGTGKSQVLANVAAAAVCAGQSVLFASKNNRAVDVVVDRLRRGVPGAVVRTGNRARRRNAAEQLRRELPVEPPMADARVARQQWAAVGKELDTILSALPARAALEAERDRLQLAIDADLQRWSNVAGASEPVDGDIIESAVTQAEAALREFGRSLGWFWRRRRHERRLAAARLALAETAAAAGIPETEMEPCLAPVSGRPSRSNGPATVFQPIAAELRVRAGAARARYRVAQLTIQLTKILSKHAVDDQLHAMTPRRLDAGRALVAAEWGLMWRKEEFARAYALKWADLLRSGEEPGAIRRGRRIVADALPAVPLWAVTNLSVGGSLPLINGLFDLVVIDEASQCDMASALPLLVRAKRALIVGDPHQLPHVTSLGAIRERRVAELWGLDVNRSSQWCYRTQSLFNVAAAQVPSGPITLDLHFRSHPAIAAFMSEEVYGGKLELCWEGEQIAGVPAIEWIEVAGQAERCSGGRSWRNQMEAERVVQEIAGAWSSLGGRPGAIGVVTPYAGQVAAVRSALHAKLGAEAADMIMIGTAHAFQGSETDVLYFSTVADRSMPAHNLKFAAERNLVNVALSRARRRLVVVGDLQACMATKTILKQLAIYVTKLQAGGFDSGLEAALSSALLDRGIVARTGKTVGAYRLDLAVETGTARLDIECDGAAFHVDQERDAARDRALEAAGWTVLRFSGREISQNVKRCAEQVEYELDRLASTEAVKGNEA